MRLTIVVLTSLLVGCASSPEPPKPMTFYVESSYEANDGHLVYMVVRSVNEKQFIDETYPMVASKVFPLTDDPTLLGVHPIKPGEKKSITATAPTKGPAAIYFMFTDPGPYWKTLLNTPLDGEWSVNLTGHNTVQVGDSPGFFGKWFY